MCECAGKREKFSKRTKTERSARGRTKSGIQIKCAWGKNTCEEKIYKNKNQYKGGLTHTRLDVREGRGWGLGKGRLWSQVASVYAKQSVTAGVAKAESARWHFCKKPERITTRRHQSTQKVHTHTCTGAGTRERERASLPLFAENVAHFLGLMARAIFGRLSLALSAKAARLLGSSAPSWPTDC